jgi:hypothetical protein
VSITRSSGLIKIKIFPVTTRGCHSFVRLDPRLKYLFSVFSPLPVVRFVHNVSPKRGNANGMRATFICVFRERVERHKFEAGRNLAAPPSLL